MWAAFPDVGVWWLTIPAVTLFHTALSRDHAGWGFLVGLVTGLTFFLPMTRWASFATETVPWLALGLLGGLGFGLFGAMWTWAKRLTWVRDRLWAHVLAFGAAWVAVEQWRSWYPWSGFPWGRLAWATAGTPASRWAWLGGSAMASFAMAVAGVLLAVAITGAIAAAKGRDRRVREGGTVAICAALGVLAVVGPLALPLPDAGDLDPVPNPPATAAIEVPDRSQFIDAGIASAESGVLRAGAVQGNVPNVNGVSTGTAQQLFDNHLAGTADLAQDIAARASAGIESPGLDLVLWPEDGGDAFRADRPEAAAAIDEAASAIGAPLLFGSQEYPETGGRYNVILAWQPGTGITGRYAKQRPVAFGEYIPWRPLFRLLSDQVDRVNTDMISAVNDPVIVVPAAQLGRDVPLGFGICFEVAYDSILRDAVRLGAEALVIPTNNASFGISAESTQQLQMVRIQAIATGRAVVQVSTNGVSAVVAPDGTVVARSGLFTADRFNVEMPLRTSWTPAVAAGTWIEGAFSAAGGLLALGGLVAGIVVKRRARKADA
jgi:apolipoprotein N-acyltransferase